LTDILTRIDRNLITHLKDRYGLLIRRAEVVVGHESAIFPLEQHVHVTETVGQESEVEIVEVELAVCVVKGGILVFVVHLILFFNISLLLIGVFSQKADRLLKPLFPNSVSSFKEYKRGIS
jgi:hypothetical protein